MEINSSSNNQNFISQNNRCFCNLSVRFKNQNSNYHIIKLYKYGIDQPIYNSGPIQTNNETKNIINMFLDCNQESLSPPVTGPTDPSPITSSLLLHFDGTNNSTSFADSSGNNLILTSNNGAKNSTTQSKFGGSSAYFSNSHIAISDSDNSPIELLSFGSAEQFTVDFWAYVTPVGTTYRNLLEFGTDGSFPATRFAITIYPNNILRVENFDIILQDIKPFPINTWAHIAVSRDSQNIMRLFINGEIVASKSVNQQFIANSARIGKQWDGQHFSGYIDELRIIKGSAAYTDNFTPPSSPYIA